MWDAWMNGDGGVNFKAWLTSVLYKYNVLIEAPNIEWPDRVEYEMTGGTRLNFKLINRLPSETEPHKGKESQTWPQAIF